MAIRGHVVLLVILKRKNRHNYMIGPSLRIGSVGYNRSTTLIDGNGHLLRHCKKARHRELATL